MTLFGKLQKITNQKKLMIQVDQETYERTMKTAKALAKNLRLGEAKLPTWTFAPDDEDSFNGPQAPKFYVMVKLDRYDMNNIVKFERLVRHEVIVNGNFKAYDFIPEGETEQKCGVNFVLTSISKRPVKKDNEEKEFERIAKAGFEKTKGAAPLSPTEQELSELIEKRVSQQLL